MLITKRPTASTVQYTVSTRCQPTTITSRALVVLGFVTRVISACIVACILAWQYELVFAPNATTEGSWLSRLNGARPDRLLHQGLSTTNHLCILAACITTIWLVFRRGYTEESLLVMRGLGVQTSTSSSSYLLSSSTRFIPTTAIQDIFIHEAFIGFKVKFYLSIVVEGEDKVVVVFPTILPRLDALETVWRGARSCLYEPKS